MSKVYEGERWVIQFDCDWLQFWHWQRWNWINFSVISLVPEWDRAMGSVELAASLLGFRARLSYTYDASTPKRVELSAMVADLDKCRISVPLAEYKVLRADAARWRESVPVESLGRDQ